MPLEDGATFAGYTIILLLGSGGMGEVYLIRIKSADRVARAQRWDAVICHP
ncbi:MAG: hypothetical protein QOD10_1162 [Mycobacterium sp.]|jgi:hypothetical protein|nr:hypothetical protein [Mycobacterium sp.]